MLEVEVLQRLHRSEPGGPDPDALLEELVARLTPGGVVVLETPVLTEVIGDQFREVVRSDGPSVRLPEAFGVRNACARHGFTYRYVGQSPGLPEDEHARLVYHLGGPVRDAWLLLEPSTFGKTTKAQRLAQVPGTRHIVCDDVLIEWLAAPESAPASLSAALEGATNASLDRAYEAIARLGVEREFVESLVGDLPDDITPILDVYLPEWGHEGFLSAVEACGYQPVRLAWEHPVHLIDEEEWERCLSDFRQWSSAAGE